MGILNRNFDSDLYLYEQSLTGWCLENSITNKTKTCDWMGYMCRVKPWTRDQA